MKLKKWLPVALGSIIALGSSVAAQADATLDKIEQRHVLVVGVLLSGGPFGSIDPATQKPKGLNVDLANELGRQLKAEVQLVPVLPANRVQFLQQGKVDMVISTRSDPNLEGFALRTSPVWWICSAQYIHQPSEPLPLILVDEPSIYRRYALEALERANIPWRQAYLASNLIGIKAATRAGLGVTPRSMEMLGPDMRVLGETDGLPRLPEVTYYLWIRPNTANPIARKAYDLIRGSQGL